MEAPRRYTVTYRMKPHRTPIGEAQIIIIAENEQAARRIAQDEIWRQSYHVVGFDQIVVLGVVEMGEE